MLARRTAHDGSSREGSTFHMLADILIRALRPIIVPLVVEALEQHTRSHTHLRTFYLDTRTDVTDPYRR